MLILNPLFTKQAGEFADTEGLGFQYGWRGVYALNSHWGLGVEMFGEIEDLANAGSSLWYASHTFESEGDGGLEGAKLACRAVARFIGVRHENPVLAAPFLTTCSRWQTSNRV